MQIHPGSNKVAADDTIHIERLPLAVGTLLGTSIFAAILISVDGLIGKDQWLTNALYGFCVAIPDAAARAHLERRRRQHAARAGALLLPRRVGDDLRFELRDRAF